MNKCKNYKVFEGKAYLIFFGLIPIRQEKIHEKDML
jgi:hypothetical protein